MRQLSQIEVESFSPGQATELIHVLDLQAEWENHRDDPTKNVMSLNDLRSRQKAFELFRNAQRNYGEKYWNAQLPEMTQNTPERLAMWCRILHAVFLRAEGVNPGHTMAKVYRLADRIALRLRKEPVARGCGNECVGALAELGSVIGWCDALVVPAHSGKF